MKGFTPKNCALFCAHPPSKTIADGSSRAGKRIARNGAKNQHDSKPSHSVLIVFGRSLNQRVAEFSFCTPSAPPLTYTFKQTWTKSLGPCFAYGLLGPSVLLASVGSINKPRLFAAKRWPLGATWALLQRDAVEIAMHVVVQGSRQFWLGPPENGTLHDFRASDTVHVRAGRDPRGRQRRKIRVEAGQEFASMRSRIFLAAADCVVTQVGSHLRSEPAIQMFANEIVVVQVRIRGIHPFDLFELSSAQGFLRVQAPDSFQQALPPQHLMNARDTSGKLVISIKESRVAIRNLHRSSHQILRVAAAAGRAVAIPQ